MLWGNGQLVEKYSADGPELFSSLKAMFFGKYPKALDYLKSQTSANAVNNQAVCMLYSGQVKEAVERLLVYNEVPPLPLILNLYTVAELGSTKTPELRAQHFMRFASEFSDQFEPKTSQIVK
jgi:hypothetical protein